MSGTAKLFLEEVFREAVAAVDPARLVRMTLTRHAEGVSIPAGNVCSFARWDSIRNIHLVGGGKAARAMGEAAAEILGNRVTGGVLAVPRGKGGTAGSIRFIETGHPFPDEGSRKAAGEIIRVLSEAGEDDLVVALISGGGSAMVSLPPDGISHADKEETARLLMNAGADISEINAVRKHMSLVKGGRMARTAYPARVFALLLSDVPDDDPSVIASGPFSPDPATFKYAMEIIVKRGVLSRVPPPVCAYLESGISGAAPETPKHGDPAFNRVATNVIGSNLTALEAVSAVLKMRGIAKVRVLPGFLHGEARECARAFTAELRKTKDSVPAGDAAVLVAGGETAVTVPGDGKGGRCQEFSLSAAIEIEGRAGLAVLCAGTDGIDGPTEAAGAYADGSTCSRAAALGLDPRDFLGNNDSHSFFRRLSDLAITGPTGTNVADIAIGLAGSPP